MKGRKVGEIVAGFANDKGEIASKRAMTTRNACDNETKSWEKEGGVLGRKVHAWTERIVIRRLTYKV